MTPDLQFSRLDIAFSHFLAERTLLSKKQKKEFQLLCARLSHLQSQGHSCIIINPAEQQLLRESGLVAEKNRSPLVIEDNRLYLQRYWFYENRLAEQINSFRARNFTSDKLDTLLSRYFIELIDETDWQREAVRNAVGQAFSIISGGPGTGKTTTVVKMLAILQELSVYPLHIALVAPTGKAAMRLQESIGLNINSLPCSEVIKNQIPELVTTIHYLLGSKENSPFFKHDAHNPLAYDLVVVDEASMVDLALMSKLVDALKPSARLILLGDKDQLSSVESGAILADLTTGLPNHTYELKRSYRFQSEIKALADAVNAQSADEAWQLLENGGNKIALLRMNLMSSIVKHYDPYFQCVRENKDLVTIFSAFNNFQVLCSNRQGERGVISVNDRLEKLLVQQKKIRFSGQWYSGRPVMVMQNNPGLQLYNGDIGLCLNDQESKELAIFFLRTDGSIKKVNPGRMPKHETVFAMTIHKSQGSEFSECLCVLADVMSPVLSKELLYTAITRAKEKLTIASEYTVFYQTVRKKVVRTSGLFEKLVANKKNGELEKCNQ